MPPAMLLLLLLLLPSPVHVLVAGGNVTLHIPYSDATLVLGVTVYDSCGHTYHLAITPVAPGEPPEWSRITTSSITASYRLAGSCPPEWIYIPTGLLCNNYMCILARPEHLNRTWLRYTLAYPLLKYVNSSSVRFVRSVLPANVTGLRAPHSFWALAEWAYSRFFYDLGRAQRDVPVYTPEEFYRHGGGMCSDYSLFMVAASVALGYRRVAVLVVDVGDYWHAVPGVWYNGTVYVTDFQPYLVDYRLYVPWWATSQSVIRRAYLYTLELTSRGPVLTIRRVSIGGQPAPLDQGLATAVCRRLSVMLGARCGRIQGMRFLGDTGDYITRFYSPVFREWARYYARLIAGGTDATGATLVYVEVRGRDVVALAYP